LAGKVGAAVLISTTLFTVLGSTAAFIVFREASLRGSLETTLAYLQERRKVEERVYERIKDAHVAATQMFRWRLEFTDSQAGAAAFDEMFPRRLDGTRRSAGLLFDGGYAADGEWVSGVGAFMADAGRLTPQEKTELYVAYTVLRDLGPTLLPRLDNIYFFTPHDRMVIYAPEREDRLLYYRDRAPATFGFQHEEFAQLSTLEANPSGATRCTGLRRLLSDPTGEQRTSGCMTPVNVNERRVGVWGSSLTLAEGLRVSIEDAFPGAANAILDRQGELIAHADLLGANVPEAARAVAQNLELARVHEYVRNADAESGIVPFPVAGNYVVFARIAGPDWLFLSLIPEDAASWRASGNAAIVLILGAAAAIAQVLLLAFLIYRWVVAPARRLTEAAKANAELSIGGMASREDEIGELARALAERDKRDNQRIRDLAETTKRAEAANVAKSQFLTTMSHELRTPLNAIIGYSEILREDAEEDARHNDVSDHDRILGESRRLLKLVNEILDLSRIEAGKMRVDFDIADPVSVVREAIELARPQADANGNTIILENEPSLSVCTDSLRLGQCLVNLLSNAAKFTKNGRILVRILGDAQRLRFEVEDNGIGIEAGMLEFLFEPFVQADSSASRHYEGAGLGLAITRRIARLLGGDVAATSVVGAGSVFVLEIVSMCPTPEECGMEPELESA
jgi:signal transduction histidine kinase